MMRRVAIRCGVCCAISVLASPGNVYARRGNVAQAANGSTASGGISCLACHGGSPGSGSVQILNAPAQYQANHVYDLTIRVMDPFEAGAGFQLSVEDAAGTHVGTLIITDAANTTWNNNDPNWVNHTETGVVNSITNWASLGSAAEFEVRWQAPGSDVGPLTFWAVGNAINNNNSPTSDKVYLSNATATFVAIPAASEWGLLALALSVMTAATVVLGRRSLAATAKA
ncbi:MAG: choice-of-anchor V domain-containing protein [Planctomycetota bacterium]